ncbi:MAG: TonB-dependent receptor [Flavobacteriaceae bacterium]
MKLHQTLLRSLTLVLILLTGFAATAQTGTLKGRVLNKINNEPIPFANITLTGTSIGVSSDFDGYYRIENLEPGLYNVSCSFLGFSTESVLEIQVSTVKPTTYNFYLKEEASTLSEVEISSKKPFKKSPESPLSKQTIGASEIYRSPGGNRDISKVLQILPGVASSASFRNDIIIRGGAPNENRFFLDGVEVPNINHFATQGSSGGPVGMLNVNFIKQVDFYSGAFPANRGNAMSSVIDFEQISGNDEKLAGTFQLGSSDVGLTLDGPIGEKSTFILSARRSYLQFLFAALKLPFLPTYNDFQYKQEIKINQKNTVTIIGLGAIDDFELNTDVNDGVTDQETIDQNDYLLGNLPVNTQSNYAIGATWKHFSDNSNQLLVVSQNYLNNQSIKYQDNIEEADNLILNYKSKEIEEKVRFESNFFNDVWRSNVGAGYQRAHYTNETYNKKEIDGSIQEINFSSILNFNKYALFGSASRTFFDESLMVSLGLRTDFNDYSEQMSNPLDQLSPRISLSYAISEKLNFNTNLGIFYQLPAYTVMGYRDSEGNLVNKDNEITYIQSKHIVAGFEFNPTRYSKITLEGFHKKYNNYPFLINEQISLANLGSDFGVIGNEPVESTSKGRAYGIEFLAQQRVSSSVYGIISYTWVRSEFQDANGVYIPSAWDNKHVLNVTAGKQLKKNWEVGAKFRLLGGAPYTPYDVDLSSQKDVWDVTGQGVLDYSQLNTERNPLSHGLDIRVDKKWFFSKWALNAYLDLQNIYNFQSATPPYLDVERDQTGAPITDPNDPNKYLTYEVQTTSGTVLPSIGIMVDF